MHLRVRNTVGQRGLLRVVWPFAALTCCLVLLAAFSMELLSATRAYVGGEGLWSKGQKQAAYALQRYADSRAPADFEDYLASIAIPLGDRRARLELEKAAPDLAVVRAGFLEGRNELDDIPGMIRLYRWFRNVSFMARAIEIWTEADLLIVELTGIAGQLHQEFSAPAPDPARISALLAGVDRLNRQLTPLEDDFSRTLGEASRLTRNLLVVLVALASALLLAIAVLLTRRLLRQNAASAQALADSEERYALAHVASNDGLWDWDIAANEVYYSPRFLQMLGYTQGEIEIGPEAYVALVHPEDVGSALHALEQHRQKGAPYDVDYRLRTRSGQYRWFRARGESVRGADGLTTRMAGSITDISERMQAEEGMRQGEAQLRNILQAVPFPILITRSAGNAIVYANDYAMRQFKLPRGEDPRAQSLKDFVATRDRDSVLGSLGLEGTIRMHEIQMRDSEGEPFWALVSAQSVTYQGEECMLIGLYDITERKRRDDDIRRIAFRDTLTRLPNRASFDRNLARALTRAAISGKRMALLFVDLDQFKYVNDTYGHKGGDRLLQAIAIRLANSVRKTDFVARLGGDEFVVLLPEFDDLEAVAGLAWKLLGRISKPLLIEGQPCRVTASIGISCLPDDGTDLNTLLKHADVAMYRAKAEGKNRFRFHSVPGQFDRPPTHPGDSPAGKREVP